MLEYRHRVDRLQKDTVTGLAAVKRGLDTWRLRIISNFVHRHGLHGMRHIYCNKRYVYPQVFNITESYQGRCM